MAISFVPQAVAATSISSLNPTSASVGTQVQLLANITTANAGYEVRFDDNVLASGNATGTDVDVNFTVPQTTAGVHNVKIVDVTTGDNATQLFAVLTSLSLKIDAPEPPQQFSEGDSVPITVNITGGEPSRVYTANVTVQTPNNVSYASLLDVTTSSVGTGVNDTTYPGNFTLGANGNFSGNYKIFLNGALDVETVFVGITKSTEYHRAQAVDVKAVYAADENVSLTITGKDLRHEVNLTADSTGTVQYAGWAVPLNASIGTYTLNISSITGPTVKNPPDTQNFTVPGFAMNITTKNLAGDVVPAVDVKVFEVGALVGNGTTGATGSTVVMLELGNYSSEAFFRSQKVGERGMEVFEAAGLDFSCNLTNLNVTVVADIGGKTTGIPGAGIYLTPENKSLVTDITGSTVARSLLPNASYSLNVSRYSVPFNQSVTVPTLLDAGEPVAWFNVTVVCPTRTLQVRAVKVDGQAINGVVVRATESLGGAPYVANTDSTGKASFNAVFGEYSVTVYSGSGIKLNETDVDLFQDQNVTVYCDLYGLSLSVKVVDYFGQPLSNVNLTLQMGSSEFLTGLTQSNGTATFEGIIGGNLEVTAYLPGQTQPSAVQNFLVESSETVEIQIGRYTTLMGFLVETNQLMVTGMVAAIVVVVLVLEIYRRRRSSTSEVK